MRPELSELLARFLERLRQAPVSVVKALSKEELALWHQGFQRGMAEGFSAGMLEGVELGFDSGMEKAIEELVRMLLEEEV